MLRSTWPKWTKPSSTFAPHHSPSGFPSPAPSQSCSPSPAWPAATSADQLDSEEKVENKGSDSRSGGAVTLADLKKNEGMNGSKKDEADKWQDYYTGGVQSGMSVQDSRNGNDVDLIFDNSRLTGAVERRFAELLSVRSMTSFKGDGTLLSAEAVDSAPQPPESVNHTLMFWPNGFKIDDGPFRRIDDPANALFFEEFIDFRFH